MELYLDSANLEHIRHANSLGIINGVTTNPSLLAKEDPKVDVKKRILEIFKMVGGHLSVEVISTDTKGMLKEAEEILKWFPDATIKIPMIPSGLSAVKFLYKNSIPTNVTLVFSANQAIIAQNAGASYVSVFMGRLDDISTDSNNVIQDISEIWDRHNYESLIIAASLRNPLHLTQAAMAGAHIATVPYNVLMQSMYHPLTDAGVKKFLEDNAKLQEEINKLKAPIFNTITKDNTKNQETKAENKEQKIDISSQKVNEQIVEEKAKEIVENTETQKIKDENENKKNNQTKNTQKTNKKSSSTTKQNKTTSK